MKPKHARPLQSIQWLPTERLGQLSVDAHLRPWLIGRGLLSVRMKAACGERYALRMVGQWSGLLSSSHKLGLRADDNAGLFRDVELYCADQVWVFAQTLTPDSTLCLHPWLAELGDTALDETLDGLSGTERGSYEYAWLPTGDRGAAHERAGHDGPGHDRPDPVVNAPGRDKVGGGDPLAARAVRAADVKPAGLWARRLRVTLRGAPLLMQEVFLPAAGRV
jgi:chorismate-pyruvate lyase